MKIIIDGLTINSEEDLHDFFAKSFSLPDWYGRNLDALWDVLTGMVDMPLTIIWRNSEISKHRIANYEKFVSLLKDVEITYKPYGESRAFKLILE
jgi:ribonuclease inhibitor